LSQKQFKEHNINLQFFSYFESISNTKSNYNKI